jgi:hypothetical protein
MARRLFGGTPETTLALLRAAWPAAVGAELARRTEVITLESGTLRVRVPDATWRRGLLKMRGDILGRLRSVAGDLAPVRLGFVEGEVVATPADAPPRGEAGPAASPTASLVAAAAGIEDEEVRQRFLTVAARYLRRFGGGRTVSEG